MLEKGLVSREVVPKNLVFTENGLLPMRDVKVGMTLSHGKVSSKVERGKLLAIKIRTNGGFVLTGAKETHVIPVVRLVDEKYVVEFIYAKDCRMDDLLLLHFSEKWPKTQYGTVTESVARFLGYLVMGASKNKNKLQVTIEKNEFFESMYFDMLGKEAVWENTGYKGYVLTPSDVEFFKEKGWDFFPESVQHKRIPDCILQSPRSVVIAFLQSAFSKFYDMRKGEGGKYLSFKSEGMGTQLQLLLLNLGVFSAKVLRKNKNRRGDFTYYLRVHNIFYKKFVREIYSEQETEKEKEKEFIPTVCVSKTKFFFPKFYQAWPPEIKELLSFGYYPVTINKIEDSFECDLADISIPDSNIYVADGFVHRAKS